MKASIIIPTYNRGEVLCNTLEMALQQDFDDYEVIVVDQTPAYPPAIQEQLNSLIGRIRYYKLATPNVSAARNLGIRVAQGEILVFTDDDVIFKEDLLTSHVRNYTHEKIGGVMGLVIGSEETDLNNCLAQMKRTHIARKEVSLGDVVAVTWMSSCNISYRRKVLLEAGLFDEYLQISCEDVDMSIRVRHIGYQLLFDTKIKLIHLHLPKGGCRDEHLISGKLRTQHDLVFYDYFLLKNWRIIGFYRTASLMILEYFYRVFSRSAMRQGLCKWLQQNSMQIKSFKMAITDLARRNKGQSCSV